MRGSTSLCRSTPLTLIRIVCRIHTVPSTRAPAAPGAHLPSGATWPAPAGSRGCCRVALQVTALRRCTASGHTWPARADGGGAAGQVGMMCASVRWLPPGDQETGDDDDDATG